MNVQHDHKLVTHVSQQVYQNLQVRASLMPSFDPRAHRLPYHHATIALNTQVGSGARVAIITVPGRDLTEALTISEIFAADAGARARAH